MNPHEDSPKLTKDDEVQPKDDHVEISQPRTPDRKSTFEQHQGSKHLQLARYLPLTSFLVTARFFHSPPVLPAAPSSAKGSEPPPPFVLVIWLRPSPLPSPTACSPLISHFTSAFPGLASLSVLKRASNFWGGKLLSSVMSPSLQ